ncbi:hypothetical protein [Sphingomonas sp. TREG-RG-20F-R18-01]|nr:hypothetical protein [Sphingomonas sp. TREG-RG-20F-R18-01]
MQRFVSSGAASSAILAIAGAAVANALARDDSDNASLVVIRFG